MELTGDNPNKLFIIGNGFDLAHGLKTKFDDFFIWYTAKLLSRPNKNVNDGIMETNGSFFYPSNPLKSALSASIEALDHPKPEIKCVNNFFENILHKKFNQNWIDIEQSYFDELIKLVKKHEDRDDNDFLISDIVSLNNNFQIVKEQFIDYIVNHLEMGCNINQEILDQILDAIDNKDFGNKSSKNAIFLNFNYTKTLNDYIFEIKRIILNVNTKHIHIHGSIDDDVENIIFGYGDEDNSYYELLENFNENSVLDHFKSFGYMKNDNYRNLMNLLEEKSFEIFILGHSCGISDRVLLSTIFSHPNCNKIQIFYYQKSETENDFFEKTQQISRHFKAGMKNKMRNRIVPFDLCKPLVSYKK